MTPQQQQIFSYIQEFGSALPAKLIGSIYRGKIFPAELSKRCRELRAKKILRSERDGKFERFFMAESPPQTYKELVVTSRFQTLRVRLQNQMNLNPTIFLPAFKEKVEKQNKLL